MARLSIPDAISGYHLLVCCLISAMALASTVKAQLDPPPIPLDKQTLEGVWEAIPTQPPHPTELLHMRLTNNGVSYLYHSIVGSRAYSLFLLDSTEIKDCLIKLHFRNVRSIAEPGENREIWIDAKGETAGSYGTIQGRLWGNLWARPEHNNVFFVKGAWTRDIAAASKEAEEKIKEQSR